MSDPKRRQLSSADVRLLPLAENGYTFRPSDAAESVFDVLVDHLRQLRDRELLRLKEGRIRKSQRGGRTAVWGRERERGGARMMAGRSHRTDGASPEG